MLTRVCASLSDSLGLRGLQLTRLLVHGIFQARILEWVVICSIRGSSSVKEQTHISCISCIGRQIRYHCVTWKVQ